jgi:hypothetical protein
MTVEELFGRVAETYVQTTRLKVSAPVPIQVTNPRTGGPPPGTRGARRLGWHPSTREATMIGNQAEYMNMLAGMATTTGSMLAFGG